MTSELGSRMDWLDRLSAALTTKSMAAASGAAAAGGAAAERLPLLAEATLFTIFGHAATLPALSMLVAILAGLTALLRPALAFLLSRLKSR